MQNENVKTNTPMPVEGNQADGVVVSMGGDTLHAARLWAQSSTSVGRRAFAGRLGREYQGARDMYTALGYSKDLVFGDYFGRYDRQDIAYRIVNAPPDECWREDPLVLDQDDKAGESAFEAKLKELVDENKIWSYLLRADTVSGIGRYGVVYLGFDDAVDEAGLLKEVQQGEGRKLLFMTPLSENNAEINEWDTNLTSPRFGRPKTYNLTFQTGKNASETAAHVHWSRVIHIAEGLTESETYGRSRLQQVMNRLIDLERVVGGSGEMFWRGAFFGLHADLKEDAVFDDANQSLDDFKTQMEEYTHKMERIIRTQGVEIKPLSPTVVSPKDHADVIVDLIAAGTGTPKRILMGSERGELASSQDEKNWARKMETRRTRYVTPNIVRAVIDRLIEVGVLPEPANGYEVTWPPLLVMTEEEQANVNFKIVETIVKFADSIGAEGLMPRTFVLEKYLGLTEEEAAELEAHAEEQQVKEDEEEAQAAEEALEDRGFVRTDADRDFSQRSSE